MQKDTTDWIDVYARAGLPPEVGDAVREVMDAVHKGREPWAGGAGPDGLATELQARWKLLRRAAALPSPGLDTGELNTRQVRYAGDLLGLVCRSLDVEPATREFWADVISAAVRAMRGEDRVREGGAS